MQEDAHVVKLELSGVSNAAFFGVYDGHGGAEVARYCSLHMPDEYVKSSKFLAGEYGPALKETYLGIDVLLRDRSSIPELKVLQGSKDDNSNFAAVNGLPLPIQQAIAGHRQSNDESATSPVLVLCPIVLAHMAFCTPRLSASNKQPLCV